MNKIRSSAAIISSPTGPRTSTWAFSAYSLTKTKAYKETIPTPRMMKALADSKLRRRRQSITLNTWPKSKIRETVAPVGPSQQHQPLKEPSESSTKKFLHVYLSNNWLIAQETLKRMRRGLAQIMGWVVAEVAGLLLLGVLCAIRVPWSTKTTHTWLSIKHVLMMNQRLP